MKPTWERGGIQLYLGDCRDVLPTLNASHIQAMITDAPYGIGFESHGQHFKGAEVIHGDDSLDAALWALQMTADLPTACFFSPFRPLPVKWRSVLVWAKGPQVGIGGDRETCWKRDFELIGVRSNAALNGKRDSAVLTSWPADVVKPTGHPAEKPVGLMAYLVKKLTPEDGLEPVVIDPFMGTGTTALACIETGRKCIGIEIDRQWFALAVRRIDAALDQRRLPFPSECPAPEPSNA